MDNCPDCDELLGASKAVPPHDELSKADKRAINVELSAMQPDGFREYYACKTCGAQWFRGCADNQFDETWVLRS